MNPNFLFRASVLVVACSIAAIIGYTVAVDTTTADTEALDPYAEAGRVVAVAEAPEIVVQEYDSGKQLCVEATVERATHFACTLADADEPMLAFIDVDGGTLVVVVDPQGRIESVTASGDKVASATSDGVVAFTDLIAPDARIVVTDGSGRELTTFDMTLRGEIHSIADEAKDREPHH